MQATGPPRSDAGMGIGTLMGDGDSLARKQRNWQTCPFMFFDRYDIHTQALGHLSEPKLIVVLSSSPSFHLFNNNT